MTTADFLTEKARTRLLGENARAFLGPGAQ